MSIRRRLTALTAVLVLALGATARAQSAGDDQYVDPFGKDNPSPSGQKKSQGSKSQGQSRSQSQSQSQAPPTTAPPTTSITPSTTTPVDPSATAPSTNATGQLARTGLAPGWVGLAGGALLLGGIGLRRRAGVD